MTLSTWCATVCAAGIAWPVATATVPALNQSPSSIAASGPDASPGGGARLQTGTPSAEQLLQRIDDNLSAKTRISVWSMTIHGRRGSRTMRAKSWVEGVTRAFTEYLDPPRDAGTKMLKLSNELWTYSPSSDRTIQIAGHMLRQSVMGSDLSYEDLMEDPKLQNLYRAEVTGEATVLDRACWVVRLTARDGIDPAYHSRKLWVDKERYLALREERFATSGRVLKTTEVTKVGQMHQRWVAERVRFRDALREDGGTDFAMESVEFNARIPDHIFSRAALRK
jgi:outer membrane lipoprotein-sorting protein